MAFTFLKRIHGLEIGNSLFDEEGYKIVDQLLEKAKQKNVKIHLPVDFLCGDSLEANANTAIHDLQSGIPAGWIGLDAGPKTIQLNAEVIARANTIVWNGPQGRFEVEKFRNGSADLLKRVIE